MVGNFIPGIDFFVRVRGWTLHVSFDEESERDISRASEVEQSERVSHYMGSLAKLQSDLHAIGLFLLM